MKTIFLLFVIVPFVILALWVLGCQTREVIDVYVYKAEIDWHTPTIYTDKGVFAVSSHDDYGRIIPGNRYKLEVSYLGEIVGVVK